MGSGGVCMIEGINAFSDEGKAADSVNTVSASVNDMREYMTEVQIEKAESRAEGRAEGEDRFATLCTHLIADNRPDDLKRILSDKEYREKLFKEYDIE